MLSMAGPQWATRHSTIDLPGRTDHAVYHWNSVYAHSRFDQLDDRRLVRDLSPVPMVLALRPLNGRVAMGDPAFHYRPNLGGLTMPAFDKDRALARISRIMDAARVVSTSWADSVQWHSGYAEPGYTDPESGVIMTGNWNNVTRYNATTNTHDTKDSTPSRVHDLLEKAGAELEWGDEWEDCSECGKLVRTQADSHGWRPSYWNDDNGETVCHECIKKDPDYYLTSLEGNHRRATTIGLDLKAHGYSHVSQQREAGLHPGQNGDPKLIANVLRTMGITRFIFSLDSVGQFDVSFSVWIHKSERRRFTTKKWAAALDAYLTPKPPYTGPITCGNWTPEEREHVKRVLGE